MKKFTLLAVCATVLLFFGSVGSGWAQTTIFTETMGSGGSNGATIATWESNNYFDNDGFTMSGTGDMRNTSVSSGYTGASGTWNVMLNAATEYFQIAGVNSTGYTSLSLSFGIRKSTTSEDGSTFVVQVSSNGSDWTTLAMPALPTGTGTATWFYRTCTGTIPATATLYIKFTSTSTTEFRIDDVLLTGTPAGTPTITVTGTFSNFSTTAGTPSASQSVPVSGANLTANIDVSAVNGYEYSTTNGAPWTSTLSLASTFNGTVYVRLTGASAGTYNGTIAFSSTGASTVNKSVSGTVAPPPPANDNCAGAIALTLDATAVTGDVAGATQSIPALSCSGYTGTADDDVWYSFTTNAAGTYTITVIGSASFDAVVDLRSDACNGNNVDCADATGSGGTETITTTLAAATTYYVRVYSYGATVPATTTFTIGVATATSPTISVSTFSLTGFTYVQGNGPSTEQTFTVEGVNLTSNLTVSPSTDYEVSLTSGSGYSTPISLTPSSGTVATTTIYVRLKAGLTAGNYNSENIAASSSGAATQNVVCSGTVTPPLPTLPLYENFSYTVGQDLTANGWNVTGTNVTPTIAVTAASISYPGYLSSGIGEEVTMTVSGQDVNKSFAAQTTGTVYASFLVNVSSVATGGDYFFHLGETTIGTTFRGRVFVKRDASYKLAFGIAQSTTSPAYTAFSYDLNTTYLIVLKFDMVSGTGNDVSSIYINPPLNAAIPATGWLANTDASGTDLAGVGSVALRQGGTSAPTLKLDGIRVSTNWADIVGAVLAPGAPVATAASSISASGFTANWDASTGATGYYLDVATDNAFTTLVTGYNNLDVGNVTSKAVTGLSANTPYYYRVRAYNTGGTSGNSNTISVTTSYGAKTTDEAGDWNTASIWNDDIVPTANDNVTINHAVTLAGNADCNNLVVNGSLNLATGASLINRGTVSGQATVNFAFTANQWHLISPPIADATANTFFDRFLMYHNEGDDSYTYIEPEVTSLNVMQGYALWGETGYTGSAFVGTLNAGPQSRGVVKTFNGWNLVGNPYPSSIDWDETTGWTKTNVTNATYVHVSSTTWASYIDGVGNNGGSQYIAPCQGFFVEATGSGTLGMDNNVRVHNATPFYKSTQAVGNLVRLEVSGNGYRDEAVVYIKTGSTNTFDGWADARKLYGTVDAAAQIYSLGDTPLSINAIPEAQPVTVGIKVGTSGSYTIAATEINGLTNVKLEDTKTGIITSLAEKSYTFIWEAGENENRFILRFAAVGTPDPEKEISSIYSYDKTAIVDLPANVRGQVYVYNLAGQPVAVRESATGQVRIALSPTGVYVVKVVTARETLTKKVWIR